MKGSIHKKNKEILKLKSNSILNIILNNYIVQINDFDKMIDFFRK